MDFFHRVLRQFGLYRKTQRKVEKRRRLTIHSRAMKTKEELLAMNHEELVEYAIKKQSEASLNEYTSKQNTRLKELLAAVGIVYETYKREF